MSLNFRMILLCYHCVIVYADYTRIMLLQRSCVMWFRASQSLLYPLKAIKYSLYGIFYGTRVNACVRRLVHGAVFRVLKLDAQVSSR